MVEPRTQCPKCADLAIVQRERAPDVFVWVADGWRDDDGLEVEIDFCPSCGVELLDSDEHGELPKERCAVDVSTCTQGPDSDWFRIVLCETDTDLNFCPRHALAAEALGSLGWRGQTIIDLLKRVDEQSAPIAIQFMEDPGKSRTQHQFRVVKLHE